MVTHRHSSAREAFPFLPEHFTDLEEVRVYLRKVLSDEGTLAYLAWDGGEMAGFAAGQPALAAPGTLMARYIEERSAVIPLGGHGVREGADPFEVYGALYAALGREWVRRGLLAHRVQFYGNEMGLHDGLVNLGFGRKMVLAVAPVRPIERPAAPVEIHRAGSEDLEVVLGLEQELSDYQSDAPIFMALDPQTDREMAEFQQALLSMDGNAHFVAYRDGKPAGMMTFQNPPVFLQPQLRGEGMVYLYEGVASAEARSEGVGEALLAEAMAWMESQGFTHCALHYHAANQTGGPFWRKHGFEAAEHEMLRVLDSRIAWARKW